MSVTVQSTRFGTLEVDQAAILSFPRGLIGLGGSRYALLTTDPESPFSWLHSVDDPAVALPVMRPWRFFRDYEVVLDDAEAAALGLSSQSPTDVWVTVRAGERLEDFAANLRAPIVVVPDAGGPVGYQVINEAPDCPVRAPLFGATN